MPMNLLVKLSYLSSMFHILELHHCFSGMSLTCASVLCISHKHSKVWGVIWLKFRFFLWYSLSCELSVESHQKLTLSVASLLVMSVSSPGGVSMPRPLQVSYTHCTWDCSVPWQPWPRSRASLRIEMALPHVISSALISHNSSIKKFILINY